jgi:hypothetical protein
MSGNAQPIQATPVSSNPPCCWPGNVLSKVAILTMIIVTAMMMRGQLSQGLACKIVLGCGGFKAFRLALKTTQGQETKGEFIEKLLFSIAPAILMGSLGLTNVVPSPNLGWIFFAPFMARKALYLLNLGRLKYKHDQALQKMSVGDDSVPMHQKPGNLFITLFNHGLLKNPKFREELTSKNLLNNACGLASFQSFIHLMRDNPEFKAAVVAHSDDATKQYIEQWENITKWEDAIGFL